MMIPRAEAVIADKINRFYLRGSDPRRWPRGHVPADLFVNFDKRDVANLSDFADQPLWTSEIPLTDDGF